MTKTIINCKKFANFETYNHSTYSDIRLIVQNQCSKFKSRIIQAKIY